MAIDIKDENTKKMLGTTQYRKISTYKGKVNLHQLLQLIPEYKEAEKIIFEQGKNDKLIIKNYSACTIEKFGRIIDASKGFELKNKDIIIITLKNVPVSINLEYYM